MKIIAIGRNYAEHIKELQNERPAEPVVFLKPETAVIRDNAPFFYPDFSQYVHHEIEVVLKINKEGKNVEPQFANRYYDEIGLGIDFTARDLQQTCKEKGLPWEIAKAFNGSAPVSAFRPVAAFPNLTNINFRLAVNGQQRQAGNTGLMLFDFNVIVAYVSRFFTLKKGDLIFTGTPQGVAAVHPGDRLEGWLESEKLLDFEVK